MWVNTNTFAGGVKIYNFSLRKLKVTPYAKSKPVNGKSGENLALPEFSQDVTPVSRAMYEGELSRLNDGDREAMEESRTGERKGEDWWGNPATSANSHSTRRGETAFGSSASREETMLSRPSPNWKFITRNRPSPT
jgi:hypothetical protein